jgi:hypothetical protein
VVVFAAPPPSPSPACHPYGQAAGCMTGRGGADGEQVSFLRRKPLQHTGQIRCLSSPHASNADGTHSEGGTHLAAADDKCFSSNRYQQFQIKRASHSGTFV